MFGLEKNGRLNVVATAKDSLTDDARVLVGKPGKPPFLKARIATLERAFRSVKYRDRLPQSISGLWQADLLIGSPTSEQWIGTTLKVNRAELKPAPGLRLGVFPSKTREGPQKGSRKEPNSLPIAV